MGCGCRKKQSKKNMLQKEIELLSKEVNITKDIWDGSFTKPVSKNYKISLCTTAMNRLTSLSTTILQNIENNIDYSNVEFVVLDYNSSDGLGKWVKENLQKYIDQGVVNYFRTEEPKYYSMTHSRNIAFLAASGDMVNNIDADNFTNKGFATYLNKLANEQPEKAIFAKGKRSIRGRVGFFKNEFIDDLGGYDESIENYGFDDHDIMLRAWQLGYKLMWFGGDFYKGDGSKKHNVSNMKNKDWKITELQNKIISYQNIKDRKLKANIGKEWGKAKLIKNFDEEIEVGIKS